MTQEDWVNAWARGYGVGMADLREGPRFDVVRRLHIPELLRIAAGCAYARSPKSSLARCPVTPTSVTSSGSPAVLVEQAAQAVTALHAALRGRGHVRRLFGPALPEPLVRASLVVVLEEFR